MSADPDEEKAGPQIVPDTARHGGNAESAPPVERGPASDGAHEGAHEGDDAGTGTPDDR